MGYWTKIAALAMLLGAALAAPARAQDRKVPYWAMLRYDEVRMRVGPSDEYPIAWVYKRRGLPVRVMRVREGWRLVEDPDGTRGWIAESQLLRERGAVVIGAGLAEVRAEPAAAGRLKWRAEPGALARLLRCREAWCEVDFARGAERARGVSLKGWVARGRLWGSEVLPGDR